MEDKRTETNESYDYEVRDAKDGSLEVVIKYFKDKFDPETNKITNHSEGFEVYNETEVEAVVNQQQNTLKLLKERKLKKIVLSSEEIRIRKAMERINQLKHYEDTAKKMGKELPDYIETQSVEIERTEKFKKMWQEIKGTIARKKGEKYIG